MARIPFYKDQFPYMIVHEGKYGNSHWLINSAEDVDLALRTYLKNNEDFFDEDSLEKLDELIRRHGPEIGRAHFIFNRGGYEYENVYPSVFNRFNVD